MLAAVNDNAVHAEGVHIFAADRTAAPYARRSPSKTDVEAEAARGEPRGSILAGVLTPGQSMEIRIPGPVLMMLARQHWLLVRHLKTMNSAPRYRDVMVRRPMFADRSVEWVELRLHLLGKAGADQLVGGPQPVAELVLRCAPGQVHP